MIRRLYFEVYIGSKRFHTDLNSSCVALQAPDAAAAFIEGGLCLRVGWHRPEAYADPQRLHHLLDERGACVWQSLRHHADWEVEGQRQWLQVLRHWMSGQETRSEVGEEM